MSTTYVLPAYAGFRQVAPVDETIDRSVVAGRGQPEAVPGYLPRRGADLPERVMPAAVQPASGMRQAEFYRLRVRGRWLFGTRRALERACTAPVPVGQVLPHS